jgi:DNA-binding NarL/FixJ family response regulator
MRLVLIEEERPLSDGNPLSLWGLGLAAVLGAQPDLEVVGGADRPAASEALLDLDPGVILLLDYSGVDLVNVARELRALDPDVRLVALSSAAQTQCTVFVASILEAGIAAWVAPDDEVEDLLAAIRGHAGGAPGEVGVAGEPL